MTFASTSSLVLNSESVFSHLQRAARYKIYYGGRGAAKDWSFAEEIVRRMATRPIRVLCTRELQNSIADSSHKVLSDTIRRMGVSHRFEITKSAIKSVVGAETLYKGMRNNSEEVKSTEGVDIVWVSEAQNMSKQSITDLRPTIRKSGSELWISFNVTDEQAPIYQLVKVPFPGAIIHKVNYTENPFMSDELRAEMEYDRRVDYEAYLHVWEGMPRHISDAIIFGKKVRVEAFSSELRKRAEGNRIFQGADFGFANDPSTLIQFFIVENVLYIEYEAYGLHVELDDMDAFYCGGRSADGQRDFAGVPEAKLWPIKGDNSRPETISFMAQRSFRMTAAEKWNGCVEDGITHIKGFKEIVIHPRCVHTAAEARLYAYKTDPRTIDPKTNAPIILPIIVDAHNHCWDAIRYGLDGYIQRRGALGKWAKLGRSSRVAK